MRSSKVAIVVSRLVSIIQMIAGIILLIIFGISTLVYILSEEGRTIEEPSFFIFCLVFDAIGITCILFSKKRSKLIREFKKYVSYISADPTGSIAKLATSMGMTENVVKKNLELMIRRNYFVNAYINQQTNCIIINSISNEPRTMQQTAASNEEPQIQMIVVTCKSCGAPKKIVKGSVSECDYCGSPINS